MINLKALVSRKKTITTAFNGRDDEYKKQFSPVDYSLLYKHVSDYSNCAAYEDKILWQEFLVSSFLEGVDWECKIKISKRSGRFFEARSSSSNADDKREDIQCKNLCGEDACVLGRTLDYQVPLKAHKTSENAEVVKTDNAGLGKIDLISIRDGKLNLIEYKIPKSNEPLLRAVVEVITYFYNINGGNAADSDLYRAAIKKFGSRFDGIAMSVVVPKKEYEQAHPYAYELIERYDIGCYTFDDEDNYKSVAPLNIREYKEKSETKFKEFKSTGIALNL